LNGDNATWAAAGPAIRLKIAAAWISFRSMVRLLRTRSRTAVRHNKGNGNERRAPKLIPES
jgi:hypothetical protein